MYENSSAPSINATLTCGIIWVDFRCENNSTQLRGINLIAITIYMYNVQACIATEGFCERTF